MNDVIQDVLALKNKGQLIHGMDDINAAIDKIAAQMQNTLADENPVFLCVMNGAVIFMGHLLVRLNFPLQINYIHATRYQGEIEGSQLFWKAEPTTDLKDRTVVLVEDILDTGLTLSAIIKYCDQQGAKKIYTAALVDKSHPRSEGGVEQCDFTGLVLEDKFLYGFGLDYKDYLRNEPGIYAVET
jgi:hypoxanthine phosphoribosyltransferase